MQPRADVLVVSATPHEALIREWQEQKIDSYVALICGQELGTKKESLQQAREKGGYGKHKILMIGDAPGDQKAAEANEALFYPINPGAEEASWKRLHKEGLAHFFTGSFAGAYQAKLLAEFHACLPATPPWPVE